MWMSVCLSPSSGDVANKRCDKRKRDIKRQLNASSSEPSTIWYKNVDGVDVDLTIVTHQPHLCHEYIVTSPKFNYRRWLLWTGLFYAAACALQLHLQDIRILTALLVFLVILLLLKLNFKVHRESLLVIASVGIQLTTTFASGRRTAMFYDMSDVAGVVINEAVTMHRVVYYLTILLGQLPVSNLRLVPLLTHTWPSLNCLLHIHRHLNILLTSRDDKITTDFATCS